MISIRLVRFSFWYDLRRSAEQVLRCPQPEFHGLVAVGFDPFMAFRINKPEPRHVTKQCPGSSIKVVDLAIGKNHPFATPETRPVLIYELGLEPAVLGQLLGSLWGGAVDHALSFSN